jgi:hypothetical protein
LDSNQSCNRREITNGIVSDIKSKIETYKRQKTMDKETNKTDLFDLDINKDTLNKYRKSIHISLKHIYSKIPFT